MDDPSSATSHDASRLAAAGRDMDYTLSLDEVGASYASAGHARTLRTLQRYCASGHLDAQKIATTLGDKYLVTPASVARHIAQIEELQALATVAPGRDVPRPFATSVGQEDNPPLDPPLRTTDPDQPRQPTTGETEPSRYVARLEHENEFPREQIDRKDKTIDSLIERDRETNILVRGLQEMLTPLLGAPRRDQPPHEARN